MDCVFCKIIKGEIPSYKVYEDEEFIAILDIFPNTKGMTLVIPKKHYSSYVFDMPEDVYNRFLLVTKKVAKAIDKALNVKRTAMVMEGMGVDHAHIKLYPLHDLKSNFEEIIAEETKFFEKYPGYVTTHLGPRADDKELKSIAEKITKSF